MRRACLAAVLLLAALLPGCASVPPAAIGAIAGAAAAEFRLDDEILKLVFGPSSQAKGSSMSTITSLSLVAGSKATIPLVFSNQSGFSFPAPASGGTVTVDNPAIVTPSLSPDGTMLTILAVADGSANVTYTDGTVTATLPTTVSAAVLSSVGFGQPQISSQ